jgi:sugar phosphate isomerase/epimerase
MVGQECLGQMVVGASTQWYPGADHLNFREVLEALRLIGYTRFISTKIAQQSASASIAWRALTETR